MNRVQIAQDILHLLPALELRRFQYRNEIDHEDLTVIPDVLDKEAEVSIHIKITDDEIVVTLLRELPDAQGFETIRLVENAEVDRLLYFLEFWCPRKPVPPRPPQDDEEIPF